MQSYATGFLNFAIPLHQILQEMGGKGQAKAVTDRVIELIEERDGNERRISKHRASNQIGWARLLLIQEGLMMATSSGLWQLTELGTQIELSEPWLVTVLNRHLTPAPA